MAKGQAAGWDPTKGVTWTAETGVSLIETLVEGREEIFRKHRQVNDATSYEKTHEELRKIMEKDKRSRTAFERYTEFCAVVNIPKFPLSISTIALFLFAKCSFQNGYYETAYFGLRRLHRQTVDAWDAVVGYGDIEDSDEMEDALKEFMKERKGTRVVGSKGFKFSKRESSARAQSDINDELDLSSDSEQDDSASSESEDETDTVKQLDIPNLPQHGDRFSSIDELLIACYRALLPVYGNGAKLSGAGQHVVECSRANRIYSKVPGGRCKWRIGTEQVETMNEVRVDYTASQLLHNHGAAEHLKKNPKWRPPIKNPVVRAAFGLAPLELRSLIDASQQNQTFSNSDEQPSKKLKYSPYRFDSFETSHYSPSSPMLTNHSLNNNSNSQVSNSSRFVSNPQFASPQFASPQFASPQFASSSTPSQLTSFSTHPFSMPQSQSISSIASSSLAQITSSELSPFFPQIERFLRALHPSLSGLALSIFSAGIDSFDMLCMFNAFESDTLAKFLELIQSQDVKQEISKVHLKLLQKKLEEAKAGGWDD